MATVWQVAAGAYDRDYSQHFMKYGLMFMDSGHSQIEEVRDGDLILLKHGISEVRGVGRAVTRNDIGCGMVENETSWLRDFDGWDLPRFRHVEWHPLPEPMPLPGLIMGTLKRSNQQNHLEFAERILQEYPALDPIPQPGPTRKIKDEEIIESLIGEGLRPANAEDLTAAIGRIRRLTNYYYHSCEWEELREYEMRSFLILPLLVALGWSEQQMKMEWNKFDIACFAQPFKRRNDRPRLKIILESKNFGSGLDYASTQASAYAGKFPECRVIAVSNGYCYKVYKRYGDKPFSEKPSAYLNLLSPRNCYPLDPERVEGALEVFKILMPTYRFDDEHAEKKDQS